MCIRYRFNRVKIKLENELNIKQDKLMKLIDCSNDTFNKEEQNKMIEKCINEFLSMKSPSRELVISLIERVDIYEDKKLDIKFAFNVDLQTYVWYSCFCKGANKGRFDRYERSTNAFN